MVFNDLFSVRTFMTRSTWPGWLSTMCVTSSAFATSHRCRISSVLCTATQLLVASSSRPSSLAVTTSLQWDYIMFSFSLPLNHIFINETQWSHHFVFPPHLSHVSYFCYPFLFCSQPCWRRRCSVWKASIWVSLAPCWCCMWTSCSIHPSGFWLAW